jgi:hypothetical protein
VFAIVSGCTFLGAQDVAGRDLPDYRGLHFGMSVADAVKQTGIRLADVTAVHQRPALIQELVWRASRDSDAAKADPVQETTLSFFNGDLYRIVVNYDSARTEGMTPADVVEAVSRTWGTATHPGGSIAYHSHFAEVAPVLARWDGPNQSYDLLRANDYSGLVMVLYSKKLDALAQASIMEAVRLDAQEAPQKEIERQRQRNDDASRALEKARSVNVPNFRP